MDQLNHIAYFVKFSRRKLRLTQEDLAEKAGVGLRFIRDLEQGKESLRMDKVNQVLALFGYEARPISIREKDQWEIIKNKFNRNVHVYLKDGTVLVGFLIRFEMEAQRVTSWTFVSNNDAREHQRTKDKALERIISDEDLVNVELVQP